MPSMTESMRAVRGREIQGLALQCPRCSDALEQRAEANEIALACRGCGLPITLRNGIWHALPVERAAYYARFIHDYQTIRAAEGRGSQDVSYYLGLPYEDRSGNNQAQWKIRARTYDYLYKHILPELLPGTAKGARILDIGAGNGWLSYRLAQMGHRPVAVDLLINDQDGLGAAKHYQGHLREPFSCFQAESTRLPFAANQFDAVIFNASFHYAESYVAALHESMRCLRPGGTIVIADSPWYSREASGERMVAERQAAFLKRFGTSSNSIASLEYLTDARLNELEELFGIRWERHSPFYGVRWSLRPVIAGLRRRREPARFRIYTARKPA